MNPTSLSRIFAPGLFEGQTAFITGGGTGIGLAIARELGRLGARVAIASRKQDHIDAAAEQLRAEGIDCFATTMDIRDPERVTAVVAELVEHWGHIDILVNNAGGQFPAPAATFTPNGWNAVINTNLNGPWYVTQQVALQAMIPQNSGRIVSIVADMWRGFPGMAHTGAARAAMVNLAKTLAVEWAPFNIKVNCVAPGVIESSGFQRYPEEIRKTRWQKIPLKRLGTEDEVAWMVVYLVSPAGDYVTGTTFRLDGGASLWGEILDIPDPETPPTPP